MSKASTIKSFSSSVGALNLHNMAAVGLLRKKSILDAIEDVACIIQNGMHMKPPHVTVKIEGSNRLSPLDQTS